MLSTTRSSAAPAAQPPAFSVVGIILLPSAGNLRCFASVKIGPLTVHKFRLIQQAGQSAWVSPPQEDWTDAQGTKRWKSLLEIPDKWKEPLTRAVIAAYEEAKRNQEGGQC